MKSDKISLYTLGHMLISMWWKGYVPLDGYTVVKNNGDGTHYLAVWIGHPKMNELVS